MLDSALRKVLGAGEKEPEEPMEFEETEVKKEMEISGENLENFSKEAKHTISKSNSSSKFRQTDIYNFGSLDPSRQPVDIEIESNSLPVPINISDKPSLCQIVASSRITGGQGAWGRGRLQIDWC